MSRRIASFLVGALLSEGIYSHITRLRAVTRDFPAKLPTDAKANNLITCVNACTDSLGDLCHIVIFGRPDELCNFGTFEEFKLSIRDSYPRSGQLYYTDKITTMGTGRFKYRLLQVPISYPSEQASLFSTL